MERVVIAYNNAPGTVLSNFLEACADDIKQSCYDNKHSFTSVCPPNLQNQNIVEAMENHTICFVAAHGDSDGIYNEVGEDIISTHTTNYCLCDKVFYSISCSCGTNLGPQLKKNSASLFVGYKSVFRVGFDEDAFRIASTSGLIAILNGKSFVEAKKHMLDCYDDCISRASLRDALFLLNDKENLCFG